MIIKTPWTTQPQQACEIDLKLGPSAAWNFATKRDAVSGLEMVLGASNSSGVWRDGRYINVTGASNLNRVECVSSVSAIAPGAGDFTVTVTFVFEGLTGGYSAFGRWNTGATPSTSDWFLGAGSTFGDATADFTVACGSSVYSASAAGAWVVGNKYTFIGRRRGTTIYVDRYNHTTGVWVSGSTTNAGITTINYNAARKTKLGEIDIGAGYNIAATYSTAATFKRCLSGAEVRSLSANPWQIFKPISRRIFAPVSDTLDILLNMTTQAAEGVQTSFKLDVSISQIYAQALAQGIQIDLGNSILIALNAAQASAIGNTSTIDVSILTNTQTANTPSSTISLDVLLNLLNAEASATSYGFGSGANINMQSIGSAASGLGISIDKALSILIGGAISSSPGVLLDKVLSTNTVEALAFGIHVNNDISIDQVYASAIAEGIQSIIGLAISMQDTTAIATGSVLNIDTSMLLKAGIAEVGAKYVQVVFGPTAYTPAYILFTNANGTLIYNVSKDTLIGTSSHVQTVLNVSSKYTILNSTVRPTNFIRN